MMSARVRLRSATRRVVFAPAIGYGVQIQSLPSSASEEILNARRLKRPSSPRFTIYQSQLTWLSSIANRATGGALSALLCGFSLAYLVAPGTFDSAHNVEFVAALPDYVNWVMGQFLSLKGAYRAGYAVLGATAVSTAALVLM
ncbi:SDHC, cytochrome b subunit of succinate dehydrogenase [Suillus lakei]|nr:SDHC, cytochrome b subunit of succinate dehydrogenase [Suillus lakei]